MTVFAVKRKLTGITLEGLGDAQQAAINKCDEFSSKEDSVKYIRSNFFPKDDSCTCLFEADNSEIVEKLNKEAALPFEDIEVVLDLKPKHK